MKKLLFALMLALGLAFTPISIKAEEPTEEPPVAEEQPTEEEPKEEAPVDEVTIEDVEERINDLIAKLEDAGYLDETDFGKWFEKNTGIAISVAISAVIGFVSACLMGIKVVKNAKETFNNSDKLSNKVTNFIDNTNKLLDEYQDKIEKLTQENAKLTEEFKAYIEKANFFIDEAQNKVVKNKETLQKLADSIEGVINEETTDSPREI